MDYSVANFYDDAKLAIDEITARGKIPIVVGGTGLYFRILLEDYDLPRVEPNYEFREELEKLDVTQLYKILKDLSPEAAEKIHINNKVRFVRTIEVLKSGASGGRKECEYDVEWIGMDFDRAELYERINMRVDRMLEAGLIDETKNLLEKHGRIKNFVGTIGYREILSYLDGDTTLDEAVDKIKQNSRNYAKRQLTWFRKNKALGF